jgi:hypothetical protein
LGLQMETRNPTPLLALIDIIGQVITCGLRYLTCLTAFIVLMSVAFA